MLTGTARRQEGCGCAFLPFNRKWPAPCILVITVDLITPCIVGEASRREGLVHRPPRLVLHFPPINGLATHAKGGTYLAVRRKKHVAYLRTTNCRLN